MIFFINGNRIGNMVKNVKIFEKLKSAYWVLKFIVGNWRYSFLFNLLNIDNQLITPHLVPPWAIQKKYLLKRGETGVLRYLCRPQIRPDKTGLKFTQKEDLNSGRKHNTNKPG